MERPGTDPMTDIEPELEMKLSGYLSVIWLLGESDVSTVNANVTDLPPASGTRSPAAIIKDTPITCPPSEPDGDPALCKSLLVLTVMPVALPDVAGPNVRPLRVIVCDPAAMLPSTRISA